MAKKPKDATYLYEAFIHLKNFEEPLAVVVDDDGWDRIVNVLEGPGAPRFYAFCPKDGVEIYVHLDFVAKINLLENLPGILFQKEPKRSEVESDRLLDEREESEATFVIRLWLANSKSREVHSEVSFEDWRGINFSLDDENTKFLGFIDGDGERVMYSLSDVAAIEAFDEHYLSSEEIEKWLGNSPLDDGQAAADSEVS